MLWLIGILSTSIILVKEKWEYITFTECIYVYEIDFLYSQHYCEYCNCVLLRKCIKILTNQMHEFNRTVV